MDEVAQKTLFEMLDSIGGSLAEIAGFLKKLSSAVDGEGYLWIKYGDGEIDD